MAVLLEEEEGASESRDSTSQEDMRKFAMLINPAAMITFLILYESVAISLDTQIGGRYVGLDILATGFFGGFFGGAGEIGLRIMPMGRGLIGFYIVPRVGGGYPVGFMATGEVGYAWAFKAFALNLGLGAGYSSAVGFLPFGNVALGFAI